uniref:Glycosyl transferase 48 domain-containing protein n=2 Tax=Alexandrium andersonii TaxID=327968 RepID=A0A7S2ANY7_9DINO
MLFIFQSKIIGYYVMNELRYGGATYVSTGRGLPTERRPFIGYPDGKTGFRIKDKDVGGLYLDYTVHTYYHGMVLLSGIVMIFCLGGMSDSGGYSHSLAFTWLATLITLISWLYAPFLFNPYQFSKRFFRKDLRAWVAFFFQEGGRKWVSWYETKYLKPTSSNKFISVSGLADVSSILVLVGLAAVFSNMYRKMRLFSRVYDVSFMYEEALQVAILLPPVFCSSVMTLVIALLEGLHTTTFGPRRSYSSRRLNRMAAASDEEAEASSSSGTEDSGGEATQCPGSNKRVCRAPIALMALAVIVLNVGEAIIPLFFISRYGWKKAFVAGIVLKFMLFEVVLNICEGLIRWRLCCSKRAAVKRERCWSRPLQLWVHSNRMAWDLITSAFIFWTLVPLVLANSLNDWVAPGLNIHQLLIYRAAHLSPLQLDKRTCDVSSDGSLSSSEDGTASAGLLRERLAARGPTWGRGRGP